MAELAVLDQDESTIPVYVIDLSSPPSARYVNLARAYAPRIRALVDVFDDLLTDVGVPRTLHPLIKLAARLFLRNTSAREETEEIRAIAKTAGVRLYLVVAFNLFLDLFMGCTSAVIKSLENGEPLDRSRMLHLRTLDWSMDPLRSIIVRLDFIRSDSRTPDKVLGSSITYVGFVGVLTGVRKDLSMSLNFRGMHNATRRKENFRFYLHHLFILLGRKQSISSLLRDIMFANLGTDRAPTLSEISKDLPPKRSTAAYLVFSDGNGALTMEKDFETAKVNESKSFVALTNHDLDSADESPAGMSSSPSRKDLTSFALVIEESVDRRRYLTQKWESKVIRARRKMRREELNGEWRRENNTTNHPASTQNLARRRSRRSLQNGGSSSRVGEPVSGRSSDVEETVSATRREIIAWANGWPTTNECTHFAAVMDPKAGKILWSRRYLTPLDDEP